MVASIKDVAREAGVSIATVSRFLNEVDVVNEETKKLESGEIVAPKTEEEYNKFIKKFIK